MANNKKKKKTNNKNNSKIKNNTAKKNSSTNNKEKTIKKNNSAINNKENTIKNNVAAINNVKDTDITPLIIKPKSNLKTIILVIIMTILVISLILSLLYNVSLSKKKDTIITKYKYKYVNDENIVFYGDSITNKYEIEHFFPDNKVINSGISGDEASDLIERIEDDVYKYNPSKVFILIGINDLNHNVDKKEILDNIQEIITKIKVNRKYAKIYIQSIYPINKEYMKEKNYDFNKELDNDVITEFNKEIEKIANQNKITYIDVYSKLLDENGNLNKDYSKEGLHLNDVGYLEVSNALKQYINEK